ncbi:MAG: hypothetical protein E7408_05420 [Ruminococcaceae bacterium]|nr:hypothetical protein [Oscillospiraceae bacterium]
MGTLAICIEDTKDFITEERVGTGTVAYIHYRMRHGLFARRRLTRFLAEKTEGCVCIGHPPVPLSLPSLSGDAGTLVHARAARFVPPDTERLSLFLGKGWDRGAILEIAARVRFLELIGGTEAEAFAEEIGAETGLSVPVYPMLRERGQTVLRLPGAPGGYGLDLSDPVRSCTFLPPLPLRPVCRFTGADGDTLAALVSFFGFSVGDVGVFCRNLQN